MIKTSLFAVAAFLGLMMAAAAIAQPLAEPATATEAASSAEQPAPAPAPAAEAPPDPEKDLDGFAAAVMEKAKRSEWLPVFGCFLMLVAWGVRSCCKRIGVKWTGTKLGGRVVAFGSALVLTVGTSIAAGQAIGLGLFTTAFGAALAASGLWEDKKDLFGQPAAKPA